MNSCWKKNKLKDVCLMKYGKMPNKSDIVEEGYPIFSGYRVVGFHKTYLYKDPEVVLIARGVGGTGKVKISPPYSFITNLSIVLQLKTKEVSKKFLFYKLSNSGLRSLDSGSAQSQITIANLENYEIVIPSFNIQTKIASILSAYDDLIENNNRRIKILEEMAQTIYNEWFVKFRFSGYSKVKMVKSELGEIPEGWKVGTIGDVCIVTPGYAFKSKDWCSEGIPIIKIKNIKSDNTIDNQNVDYVPESLLNEGLDKFILEQGDFLIAMTGATAGKIGRLRTSIRMLLNQRVAKIKPLEEFDDYIWCLISTDGCQNLFFRLADGAAQPNMSGSQIEKFKILIPGSHALKSFREIVKPILKLMDNLFNKNVILKDSRDILLPKLISGELDVENLDIKVDN